MALVAFEAAAIPASIALSKHPGQRVTCMAEHRNKDLSISTHFFLFN
jgi:hypothetical protein